MGFVTVVDQITPVVRSVDRLCWRLAALEKEAVDVTIHHEVDLVFDVVPGNADTRTLGTVPIFGAGVVYDLST